MIRTAFAFLFLFLLIAGCKNTKPVPMPVPDTTEEVTVEEENADSTAIEEPSQVVYYERTHCFGTCPVFTFRIESEGSAYYEGRNFVDLIGTYKAQVSEAQQNRILRSAESLNYQDLEGEYDEPMVMDLPAAITEIKGKQVINRYGGPNLKALYLTLDSVISELEWRKFKPDEVGK